MKKLDQTKYQVDKLKIHYILKNPEVLYKEKKVKLGTLIEKLELVSPMNVLKRGYSLVYQEEKVIESKEQIKVGDTLKVRFHDGTVDTNVIKVN